jgi:hypothetical protein
LQAVPGLIGNVVVVILTILAAILVRRSSSVAASLLAPVALFPNWFCNSSSATSGLSIAKPIVSHPPQLLARSNGEG